LGDVTPAVEADGVEAVAAFEQNDRLVDGGGEYELLGRGQVFGFLAEDDLTCHLDAVQRLAAGALRQPDVVRGPLLQQGVVAAARQLTIDDRRQPPFSELAPQLLEAAFVQARRGLVDDAGELHRQRRAADAEARSPRCDRTGYRRQRDLE